MVTIACIYEFICAICINRLSQPLEVSFSKSTVLANERYKLSCIVTPESELSFIKRGEWCLVHATCIPSVQEHL